MKNKKSKKKNIFVFAVLVLSVVNAVCNIISMFKGNNFNYLFDLKLGEACVTIIASAFIILSAIMMIMNLLTKKIDYIYLTLLLYISVILLQIPIFELNYSLFISIGILILLILGLLKEKNS